MAGRSYAFDRLDAKRREQTPQVLARLTLLVLFAGIGGLLWLLPISTPFPTPFLLVVMAEVLFFLVYWWLVFLLPTVRAVELANYGMLGAEILFHTTMVYFLGGISWLGPFAYVFGLIFTNTFLDLRRGFVYTLGAASAFTAMVLLDANGVIPHQYYLAQGPLRFADPRFVSVTIIGGGGVFFSIYAWVNWVGHQLRRERDVAVRAQEGLLRTRRELQQANLELEARVEERTAALAASNERLAALMQISAIVSSGVLLDQVFPTFVRELWRLVRFDRAMIVDRREEQQALLVYACDPDDVPALSPGADIMQLCTGLWHELDHVRYQLVERIDPEGCPLDLCLWEAGFTVAARFPLLVGSGQQGILSLERRETLPFTEAEAELAARAADFVALALERTKHVASLQELATRDPLTGVLNRRAGFAAIEARLEEARRARGHFALLVLDLDMFKRINDSFGHEAGDQALVQFARLMVDLVGENDVVCRLGGDEFEIGLQGTPLDEALAFADRFRASLRESLSARSGEEPHPRFTVAIGIACYPDDGESLRELGRRADQAMYAAKAAGGDASRPWRHLLPRRAA